MEAIKLSERKEGKMKNKLARFGKLITGVLFCAVLFCLAGCKGGQVATEAAPAAKPAEKKAVANADTQAGATVEEKKVAWSYDPTGKRDPFLPPKEMSKDNVLNPLLSYNLDQMWIDGIFVGAGRDVAHILLPDNSDWFVKVGDEIGVNRGRVKRIEPDGVVVEEQYLDPVDPQKIRIVEKFLRMEPIGTSLPLLRK
jgi:type IV pilus assembly protein PilP